jgi:hypothetical protein
MSMPMIMSAKASPESNVKAEIIPYCVIAAKKKCMMIEYNKVATGGNDPHISRAMRYSQYVNNGKNSSRKVSGYT